MKILHVNVVYIKGSTGKITYDIHKSLLNSGVESIVCYGRGERVDEKHVYKICPEWYAKFNKALSMFTGIMYGGCFFSTNRLISIIKREKPDVVHLQCINGNFVNIYRLVKWLKINKIKTVLTLHAEFMYTGGCSHSIDCNKWTINGGCVNCSYPQWQTETKSLFFNRSGSMWKRMKKAFDGFDERLVVTSVSPWLMERAKKSIILSNKKHMTVLNGVDVDIFHPYDENEIIKSDMGLSGKKIIFHATPSFDLNPQHPKGGYYVVQVAEALKNDNVFVVVAGSYNHDIEVPSNVVLLGKITDPVELAKLYSMADITLLTSIRETFSMVTAESLCCGTPVVGFKAGAPEQIAIDDYCEFVEYGNITLLNKKVSSLLKFEKNVCLSRIASDKYSIAKMVGKFINIYSELMEIC